MEAVRQVYEHSPDVITITVPKELRERRVEVILQPLPELVVPNALPELREYSVEELAAEWGVKPEEMLDPGILKFAGCMPDFPPRAQQEIRAEFDCE